ncbi:MAG: RNA polymerase sigma factor [Isosphaeraceae bacterium]
MTDVKLIADYVSQGSEEAFRELVDRHGPTVRRACGRVLQDPHEIEDAVQCTFLILMRKAPTVHDPQTLGKWLYGVALRVSSQARRDAARRRRHERRRAESDPTQVTPSLPLDDLRRVVHEELSQLPEVYRLPLSLCYLNGRSHEEAAEELGWPLGTLKVRLVRGRDRLRDRLDRRKISVGSALSLWLLRVDEASASTSGLSAPGLDRADFKVVGQIPESLDATPRARRLWALLLLLGASLVAGFGVRAHVRARSMDRDLFVSLPARLTDVLNVECR